MPAVDRRGPRLVRPGPLDRTVGRLIARRAGLGPATTRYHITMGLEVPMRDGAVLLADHYAPLTDGPAGTLLLRGPYVRDSLPTRVTMGLYAARGFHVVLQSTRGSFGSDGVFDPGYGEVDDGVDTVAWLRSQAWFTGTFATVGGSYLGFTQWALMAQPPPELATAVVTMGPHDLGRKAWGTGSFALSDYLTWGYGVAWHEHGGFWRQQLRALLTPRRLRPVFSGLPLGTAAEEVLGDGARYYGAWLQHPEAGDEYWRARRALESFDVVRHPVLLVGGWQDVFFDQTVEQYVALRARGADVALVIGPWTHGEGGGSAIRESIEWIAGRRREAPVHVFVTGEGGWRDLPAWPPPAQPLTLHPHPGATLRAEPASPGEPLRFVFDPADPTPTIGGRLLMVTAAGYRDDGALAARADVLTFTGPALEADVEVIGVPHVELAHGFDTATADVSVRISDVDPKGNSHNVSDGYVCIPAVGAAPLRIDLDPIAHRFRAGHRIRLYVAGGSFPRYARNLGTGEPLATGAAFVRTTHMVDCAGSRLLLPCVSTGG